MPGSKPGALGHLATPLHDSIVTCCVARHASQRDVQRRPRRARRHPRPAVPAGSACQCRPRADRAIAEFDEAPLPVPGQSRRTDPRQARRTRLRRPVRGGAAPARTHCRAQHPKRSRTLSRAAHPASIQGLGTSSAVGTCTPRVDQHVPGRRQRRSASAARPRLRPRHCRRGRRPERRRPAARPSSASASTPRSGAPERHPARPARSPHRRSRRRSRRPPESLFDDDVRT